MRIVILTQWFDPEPTFKGLLFAKQLCKLGNEVTVITGFPNYPGGNLYPGYKIKLVQKEVIDGVRIVRIPLYPSHSNSVLARALNYVSFAITSMLYGLFFMSKQDLIYSYHPPLTVGLSAAIIKFFKKTPLVLDIQDLWPDSLNVTGMVRSNFLIKLIGKLCGIMYKSADAIVVLSPGFKKTLIVRGVKKEKIHVIFNWCDEDHHAPFLSIPNDVAKTNSECFNLLFAGNIGKAQALEVLIDAAVIAKKKSNRIIYTILGSGVELDRVKAYAYSSKANNVIFLPRVPMSEVGRVLSSYDVLVVHLKNEDLFKITIPSKTQAYMAIGKPILMALNGDAASIIKSANCGLVAIPENPESIAKASLKLSEMSESELKKMGESGRSYYLENFSTKVGVLRFHRLFSSIVGSRNG